MRETKKIKNKTKNLENPSVLDFIRYESRRVDIELLKTEAKFNYFMKKHVL